MFQGVNEQLNLAFTSSKDQLLKCGSTLDDGRAGESIQPRTKLYREGIAAHKLYLIWYN